MNRAGSYRYCEQLSRSQAGNFYPAFRLLPRQQRLATCALYAFCRVADDCSDEEGPVEEKQRRLEDWRSGLDQAMAGRFTHPIFPALAHTLTHYRVPIRYLHDILDGVAMDLAPLVLPTFVELRQYCYRVASAVGLACIHIWGFTNPAALPLAENAGIALQLTNILRDLGEDAARGRVYLPEEDLLHFHYSKEELARGERNDRFSTLMRFQVARARSFYEAAAPLGSLLSPPGRAVLGAMTRIYRCLLETVEERGYDVFTSRIKVSPWRKLWLALSALPARFGW